MNLGLRTHRSIRIDGEEIEFSGGFADLHLKSYEHILGGEGFGTKEAMSSVQMVHDIRNSQPVGLKGEYHPLAQRELASHPFSLERQVDPN